MQNLGLNQYLQPVNTPIDQNKGAVSSYSFDAENERNTVTLSKIKNFSFSAGTGGTLQLGGTANGNGFMIIKNEAGSTIIEADSNGHHYYNDLGEEIIRMNEEGIEVYGDAQIVKFYDTAGGDLVGSLGYDGTFFVLDTGPGKTLFVNADNNIDMGAANNLLLKTYGSSLQSIEINNGNSEIRINATERTLIHGGMINVNNLTDTVYISASDFQINGASKTAIVPTTLGYRALYTSESPNVWFFDFATVVYPKWYKFWEKPTYIIDPLFLETIESISHIIPTIDKNIVQVWGIRKGFKNIRMENKTKAEFNSNNKFWSSAHKIRSKWK